MTRLVQVVDELCRPDHYYLGADDQCFFAGEYTARKGFAFSATNQLIFNLKKDPSRRNRPAEWQHKLNAITSCAAIFRRALSQATRETGMFVPMPPSKAKASPDYDDRMLQICMALGAGLDVRELLEVIESDRASHERDDRPNPDELYANMRVNQALVNPRKETIVVIDDVLTTGAHFVAAKRHLLETYPGARVVGLFVARRKPETIDWDEIGNV